MKLLAFDTCMQACSVAVLKDGECFSHKIELARGHAEKLMPMIEQVLGDARLSIRQIDRIAVTRGPGTFTGVRIGVATAKALALALGAELVGTSSLHVIAAQAVSSSPAAEIICVAMDARREQITFGLFDQNGPLDATPQIITADQVGELLPADKPVRLIGSARQIVYQSLTSKQARQVLVSKSEQEDKLLQPDAGVLARLASSLPIDKKTFSPLYLRSADAKIQTGYAVERQKNRTST